MTNVLKTLVIEVLCFVLPLDDFYAMMCDEQTAYYVCKEFNEKDLLVNALKLLGFMCGVAVATSSLEYLLALSGLPVLVSAATITKFIADFFTGMWFVLNGILVLLHVLVEISEARV